MPPKFEFDEKPVKVTLNLCGESYSVELNEATNQKCKELLDGVRRRLELLYKGIKCEEVSNEEICRFFCDGIDNLLGGEGFAEKILGDRAVNIENAAHLICYVLLELRMTEQGL